MFANKDGSQALDDAFATKLFASEAFINDITHYEFYKKANYALYLEDIQKFDGDKVDPKNVNNTVSCAIEWAKFY